MFKHFFHEPTPPTTLAKGEAIDLSIQFTLFWMPFLILLGWWTHKPFTLLFGALFHFPSSISRAKLSGKTPYCRHIRSSSPSRRLLPRQLRHSRFQDQLGRRRVTG